MGVQDSWRPQPSHLWASRPHPHPLLSGNCHEHQARTPSLLLLGSAALHPHLTLPSLMVWKQHKDILSCSRLHPCEDGVHDRPSLGSHEIIQVLSITVVLLFSSKHLKNGGPQVKE